MEEWKDIKGYEGLYQVSNLGRVKALSRTVPYKDGYTKTIRERILKFALSSSYRIVGLYKNSFQDVRTIHSLVWDAFGDEPRNGRHTQVDHIDGDKTNNRIDNLQLLTQRENLIKGHKERGRELPTGVYPTKYNTYMSRICINYKPKYLGTFANIDLAKDAYSKAKKTLEA